VLARHAAGSSQTDRSAPVQQPVLRKYARSSQSWHSKAPTLAVQTFMKLFLLKGIYVHCRKGHSSIDGLDDQSFNS